MAEKRGPGAGMWVWDVVTIVIMAFTFLLSEIKLRSRNHLSRVL